MLKIVCIDDEKEFSDNIYLFIEKYSKEYNLEYHIDYYENGLSFIFDKRNFYNLLFIDISMPEMNGIQLAKKIRKYDNKCIIVFITNLQNYAIKGYEVNAFDYILKPITYNIFSKKMNKIIPVALLTSSNSIIITSNSERKKIFINDIIYVETSKHRLIYHTLSENIEQWSSMKEAYINLNKYGFELCNSCYLVNLKCIEKISNDIIVVTGGDQLRISRPKRKSFLDAFTSFDY